MSDSAAAAGAGATGQGHAQHPQHALPVPPKRSSVEGAKGADKKFTLGFLGGGMMASALIRGLIKAEVRVLCTLDGICSLVFFFNWGLEREREREVEVEGLGGIWADAQSAYYEPRARLSLGLDAGTWWRGQRSTSEN
jgi:hypothetical protein